MKFKYIPNIITITRIIGSICIILLKPLSTIFFIIILVKFLLLERLENYIIYLLIVICSIKVVSLIVGFIKYKAVAFLHTYTNKFTGGVILICFPMMYLLGGVTRTLILLCILTSIASIEELLINLISKKLNRNVRSIFKG